MPNTTDPRLSRARCLAPLVALVALGLTADAAAQSVHFRFRGAAQSSYGNALSPAGDIDGDGHPDLLIGAPYKGSIEVRSGFDGRVLLHIDNFGPFSTGAGFGNSVAGGGDANGDGVPDVAATAGATLENSVFVHSGQTGALLWQDTSSDLGGAAGPISFVDDVDGDGRDELVVGLPDTGPPVGAGRVVLVSGADGHVLYADDGVEQFGAMGHAVQGLGDIDGDGRGDFMYSAPFVAEGEPVYHGRVRIVSGGTLTVKYDLAGPFPGAFGGALAGRGDLDKDGTPDIVIRGNGVIYMLSGDGSGPIHLITGPLTITSAAIATGADIDADGNDDLVVGDWTPTAGDDDLLHVISGRTGLEIMSAKSESWWDNLGKTVAMLDDGNGDGYGEFVGGAPDAPGLGFTSCCSHGEVKVFSGKPSPFIALGGAVGGALGTPVFGGAGTPAGGQGVTFSLSGAPPSAPVVLVAGGEMAPLPFKGGTLVPVPQLLFAGLATSPAGTLQLTGHWPPDVPGSVRWLQLWIADATAPAGLAASNPLAVTTQ